MGGDTPVDEPVVAINKVPPVYPEWARAGHVSGLVMCRTLVNASGEVQEIVVVESDPVFDESAVRCVEQWTFKPALVQGKPTSSWIMVPMKFTIN